MNETENEIISNVPSLEKEIDFFIRDIDSIHDVLINLVIAFHAASKPVIEKYNQFEEKYCKIEKENDEEFIQIPIEHYTKWKKLKCKRDHMIHSSILLPRSLFVSLFSQYDAFLGRILKAIFIKKPEIINGSEKQLTFELLNSFNSISAAREYIIEKEVESILRMSHSEQFKWMENAFKTTLTKDIDVWPIFIESSERRNLFVHTNGIVSSQYINVCKKHKCALDDSIKEGSSLITDPKYFRSVYSCIFEIGFKLAHVLWRKLFPDEMEKADTNYNNITYDLIDNKKYSLAINLLDFGCEFFKKQSSEYSKLCMTINRAQAYKWNGDDKKCLNIMKKVDWSAKSDDFKLAESVLKEDWDIAASIMKRIGANGLVTKEAYKNWPLFQNFRNEKKFLDTYSEIFASSFMGEKELVLNSTKDDEDKIGLESNDVSALDVCQASDELQ